MRAKRETKDHIGKWKRKIPPGRSRIGGSLCLFLILAAPLALLISPFSLRGEDERPTDRVVILYTGETHGNVEPCG